MAGKYERRQYYADVDMNSTERFGLLCSPFQALQLLVGEMNEQLDYYIFINYRMLKSQLFLKQYQICYIIN